MRCFGGMPEPRIIGGTDREHAPSSMDLKSKPEDSARSAAEAGIPPPPPVTTRSSDAAGDEEVEASEGGDPTDQREEAVASGGSAERPRLESPAEVWAASRARARTTCWPDV